MSYLSGVANCVCLSHYHHEQVLHSRLADIKCELQVNTCQSVLPPNCTAGNSYHPGTDCWAESRRPALSGPQAGGTPPRHLSSCRHLETIRKTENYSLNVLSGTKMIMTANISVLHRHLRHRTGRDQNTCSENVSQLRVWPNSCYFPRRTVSWAVNLPSVPAARFFVTTAVCSLYYLT